MSCLEKRKNWRALATAAARARARVRDSGGHDIEIRVESRDETLSLFCFDDLTLRHWEGPRERIQKAALVRMSIYLSIYLFICLSVCLLCIYLFCACARVWLFGFMRDSQGKFEQQAPTARHVGHNHAQDWRQ